MAADRLAQRTLELVDIPSVSRGEQELARYVRAAIPFEPHFENEDVLFYAEPRDGRPLGLLAGHLDTVPPQDNVPGRLADGVVRGLGASDMKGGLAVMIELLLEQVRREVALAAVFFVREELPAAESPLPAFFDACPLVDEAGLVVVLEPTDNTIQAGCLGNLDTRMVFTGRSAHSARPWLGVNAIDLALAGLAPLAGLPPEDVEIDGLVFREVLTITGIHGGIAGNVVPDRVEAQINYRYAPTRTPAEAEARLRELAGHVEIVGNSPPAGVALDAPLVRRLRETTGFALEPKQAWTPVAEFASRGLNAVNLGPGATRYAHTRDEQVAVAELERTYEALRRFLGATV